MQSKLYFEDGLEMPFFSDSGEKTLYVHGSDLLRCRALQNSGGGLEMTGHLAIILGEETWYSCY